MLFLGLDFRKSMKKRKNITQMSFFSIQFNYQMCGNLIFEFLGWLVVIYFVKIKNFEY